MDAPRPQAGGQEPAPHPAIDAVAPAPAATPARRSAPPPTAAPGTHALDRSNAALADALAAFQRVFDPPAPQ